MEYLERVHQAYQNIKGCDVVVDKDTSPAALAELKKYYDEVVPRDQGEELINQMVKTLYFGQRRGRNTRRRSNNNTDSRDLFLRLLPPGQRKRDPINFRCIILITEALRVVEEFKIRDFVHITWDEQSKEYLVRARGLPRRGNRRPSVRKDTKARAEDLREEMKSVDDISDAISTPEEPKSYKDFVVEQSETKSSSSSRNWGDIMAGDSNIESDFQPIRKMEEDF